MVEQKEQTSVPVKAGDSRPSRRDPFDRFEDLQEEMTRLWDQAGMLASWPPFRPLRRLARTSTAWGPRMDVYEREGTLVVKAELPGVKKEDIQVSLDRGRLVIEGQRSSEHEVKEGDYYRVERNSGSFYRALPLPFEAEAEQMKATYQDGVLEIRIPRPAEEKPKAQKIAVS